MTDLTQRVHAIIRLELSSPFRTVPEALTADMAFGSDLGADSIDRIVVTMALEDAFGVDLHEHDISACTTVGELIALVEREVAKAKPCAQTQSSRNP